MITDELKTLDAWFKLAINTDKAKYVLYEKIHGSDLTLGEKLLEGVKSIKFLGVTIDECLNWKIHYDPHVVVSKISKSLVVIRGMKQVSPPADIKGLYYALMVLRYGVRQVHRS